MTEMTWKPVMDGSGKPSGHMVPEAIWVQRMDWPEPQRVRRGELPPLMNANGLYWYPADGDRHPPALTTPRTE